MPLVSVPAIFDVLRTRGTASRYCTVAFEWVSGLPGPKDYGTSVSGVLDDNISNLTQFSNLAIDHPSSRTSPALRLASCNRSLIEQEIAVIDNYANTACRGMFADAKDFVFSNAV